MNHVRDNEQVIYYLVSSGSVQLGVDPYINHHVLNRLVTTQICISMVGK